MMAGRTIPPPWYPFLAMAPLFGNGDGQALDLRHIRDGHLIELTHQLEGFPIPPPHFFLAFRLIVDGVPSPFEFRRKHGAVWSGTRLNNGKGLDWIAQYRPTTRIRLDIKFWLGFNPAG